MPLSYQQAEVVSTFTAAHRTPKLFSVACALLCFMTGTLLAWQPKTLAGMSDPAVPHLRRAHYLMGTIFEIEVYHPRIAQAEAVIELAFQEVRRADELMSHYREESELSRLNREGAHRPVVLHADLYSLLQISQRYTEETAGAFDIATNSLTAAWRMAEQRGRPLDAQELTAARTRMGAGRLVFEDSARTVRYDRAGVRIDLGAIAKGWAVDRAAGVLRTHGIAAGLISAGTSTYCAIGAPPGAEGWSIGIRNPRYTAEMYESGEATALLSVVDLRDMSLSTSSSSEQYFEIQGKRYSHILDPRSGEPAQGLASVTVIAPSATESDALSTAVFVLGVRDGTVLLRQRSLGGLITQPNSSPTESDALTIPYSVPPSDGRARIRTSIMRTGS